MKTIPLLKLRMRLGQILDQIRIENEPILISRHEHPIAKIIPITEDVPSEISPEIIYEKWQKKLPNSFQKIRLSNDLISVIGTGEKVLPKEEKKKTFEYLTSKHG
jgi:antitoxin (DNA-binding transcriptional repressor) of toxin-antitoxin stability system